MAFSDLSGRKIIKEFSAREGFSNSKVKFLSFKKELAHPAGAFFPSPFKEAAILTINGAREGKLDSISIGIGRKLKILKTGKSPHSIGSFYSVLSAYLGFTDNPGEYKLMGLAPYGDCASERVKNYKIIIRAKLIETNKTCFLKFKEVGLDEIERLFGVLARKPHENIGQHHCDLALAIQEITEEEIIKLAYLAKNLTAAKYLCLAGEMALNCAANSKLLKENIFEDIWIQPASGNPATALGAAYLAHYSFNKEKLCYGKHDSMQGAYLGPEFSDSDIMAQLQNSAYHYEYHADFDELCSLVAKYLSQGRVIGWFQGRMEWGPRALGNRSILADPRNPRIQERLNSEVKFRDNLMPFAPSVLSEDMKDYFDADKFFPYMLFLLSVKGKMRLVIPAVTHRDGSARVQSVHRETNPRFWKLLQAFKRLTGCRALLNTSFNINGEPIVCTPGQAHKCFVNTDMDYLVIGNYIFDKRRAILESNREIVNCLS